MAKRPYDFTSWVWIVNGVPLEGFAAGDDCVEIDRNEDAYSSEVGADGRMSIRRSADRSGTITFKLKSESASNTYLGTLMDLEEGGPVTFVPVRVLCKDQNLQDIATGTVGYIKRPSKMSRGAKPGDQEWALVFERLDFAYGGASVFDM